MSENTNRPKAFIVPHASPEYSGHIATEVLKKIPNYDYDSILFLGIDHEKNESGIYIGSKYNPDNNKINKLRNANFKEVQGDHSIGWVIPLIENFSDLPIVPFVVGEYSPELVKYLKPLVNNKTLIIASTDLSHHNPIEVAGEIDQNTILNIQNEGDELDACGANAVRVLYDLIDEPLELVDYDNSSHLEGDKEKVVGYAAFQAGGFSKELLNARDAVVNFLQTGEMPKPSKRKRAAFVGITKDGELQGSMGQTRAVMPSNIAAIEAFKSTLTDQRMQYDPAVIMTPGSGFEIKIRLFTDMEPTNINDIQIGKDGIFVESGEKSAVFLPEVPTKEGWTLEDYLDQLLEKAQIVPGEDYELFKFQTEALTILNEGNGIQMPQMQQMPQMRHGGGIKRKLKRKRKLKKAQTGTGGLIRGLVPKPKPNIGLFKGRKYDFTNKVFINDGNSLFTKFAKDRTHPMRYNYGYNDMWDEYTWLDNASNVSDNIVSVFNPVTNPANELISFDMENLTEYMNLSQFKDKFKELNNIDWSGSSKMDFKTDLTIEIEKLHDEGLFHLDLHDGNIMVKPTPDLKSILDFKIIDPAGFPLANKDWSLEDFKNAPAFRGNFGIKTASTVEEILNNIRFGTEPAYKSKWDLPAGGKDVIDIGDLKYGGSLPKFQDKGEFNKDDMVQDIIQDILNANIEGDLYNKKYVQSANYRSMLERAGEKEKVINSRINAAMNFNPYENITYDVNNPSLGTYYNTGDFTSSGDPYPFNSFFGENMLNYNPSLMENHPAYFSPGSATAGWEGLIGHELLGHYGVDKINKRQRKAMDDAINYNYLHSSTDLGDKKSSQDAYSHGRDPYEIRANLAQLRYQLYKAGIYDSSKGLAVDHETGEEGDNPFTMEHLKQILEFDKDGTYQRIKPEFMNEILQFIGPQDIVWLMNNIAMDEDDPFQITDDFGQESYISKYGGSLPKAQKGVPKVKIKPVERIEPGNTSLTGAYTRSFTSRPISIGLKNMITNPEYKLALTDLYTKLGSDPNFDLTKLKSTLNQKDNNLIQFDITEGPLFDRLSKAIIKYSEKGNIPLNGNDIKPVINEILSQTGEEGLYFKSDLLRNEGHGITNISDEFTTLQNMHSIQPHRVVQPLDLSFDEAGNIIGYNMERFPGVSLRDYTQFGLNIPKYTMKNIDRSIKKLHSKGIVHGDLHAGNILIDPTTGRDFRFIDPIGYPNIFETPSVLDKFMDRNGIFGINEGQFQNIANEPLGFQKYLIDQDYNMLNQSLMIPNKYTLPYMMHNKLELPHKGRKMNLQKYGGQTPWLSLDTKPDRFDEGGEPSTDPTEAELQRRMNELINMPLTESNVNLNLTRGNQSSDIKNSLLLGLSTGVLSSGVRALPIWNKQRKAKNQSWNNYQDWQDEMYTTGVHSDLGYSSWTDFCENNLCPTFETFTPNRSDYNAGEYPFKGTFDYNAGVRQPWEMNMDYKNALRSGFFDGVKGAASSYLWNKLMDTRWGNKLQNNLGFNLDLRLFDEGGGIDPSVTSYRPMSGNILLDTPEAWSQEIRNVESEIGNPNQWTMDNYNTMQNILNQYKDWRSERPWIPDSSNRPNEYVVDMPKHLLLEQMRGGGEKYSRRSGRSYQNGGSYESEMEKLLNFIQQEEAGWDYVKNKNSAVLKEDGKTYYKQFEEGKFYPYYVENADGSFEKNATVGFGTHGADVYETYKGGMDLNVANTNMQSDVENALKNTKTFIDATYGEGTYDKLSINERFMLADYTYNLGSLNDYPLFTDAIVTGDTDAALLEYIRNDEPGGSPLTRNEGYLNTYLQPWIDQQIENKKIKDEELKIEESLNIFNSIPKYGDPGYINPFPGDRLAPGGAGVFGAWKEGGQLPKAQTGNVGEFEIIPFEDEAAWFKAYLESDMYTSLTDNMINNLGADEYYINQGTEDQLNYINAYPYVSTAGAEYMHDGEPFDTDRYPYSKEMMDLISGKMHAITMNEDESSHYSKVGNPYLGAGGWYNWAGSAGQININPITSQLHKGASEVFMHEVGHTDNSLLTDDPNITAEINKRNQEYLNIYESLDPKMKKLADENPEEFNKWLKDKYGSHDKNNPSHNYHGAHAQEARADKIRFMKKLYDAGIYNPLVGTRETNPFTQEHLDKAKEMGIDVSSSRFLRNFRGNQGKDSIWFMNNIADATDQIGDDISGDFRSIKFGGSLPKAQVGKGFPKIKIPKLPTITDFNRIKRWGFKTPTFNSKLIIPGRDYADISHKLPFLNQEYNLNYEGETGIKAFFPQTDWGAILSGMDSRVKDWITPGMYGINEPIKLMDGNTRFWLGEQQRFDWDNWYRDFQNRNQDLFPEIKEENLILDEGNWRTKTTEELESEVITEVFDSEIGMMVPQEWFNKAQRIHPTTGEKFGYRPYQLQKLNLQSKPPTEDLSGY